MAVYEFVCGNCRTKFKVEKPITAYDSRKVTCTKCGRVYNTEFEHLNLLHLAHAGDGLTVVAVNQFENFSGFEDDGARLDRFLDRHQPVFSVVRGTPAGVSS